LLVVRHHQDFEHTLVEMRTASVRSYADISVFTVTVKDASGSTWDRAAATPNPNTMVPSTPVATATDSRLTSSPLR
jgi:hypothetical protein